MAVVGAAFSALTTPPSLAEPAETLYAQWTCALCHGEKRAGTAHAPPLTGLAKVWDEERLAAYLADPAPFLARDRRLAGIDKRYPLQMPSYAARAAADRRTLATWLLRASASSPSPVPSPSKLP